LNINIQMVRSIRPHPGQQKILNSKARFRVVACGRRFGKTEIGKLILWQRALTGQHCWWLAPTYKMAAQTWRDFLAYAHHDPDAHVSTSEMRIDYVGGGSLAIRSTHAPDLLRGAGLDFVVLDEAAFMPPHIWSQIIQPMLVDRKGSALFLSTPRGHNWFHDLYQLGIQRRRGWRAFHFTSYDNPLLDPADLDSIKLTIPDRIWREEYLAQFVGDSGQVFRNLLAAATAPLNAVPLPNTRYVMGIDWGRSRDYTALVIIDADRAQVVFVDQFREVAFAQQRDRIQTEFQRWQPAVVWAEENSIGAPNVEALQAEGIPVRPFKTTAQSKAPLIEGLALAIERCDLALVNEERLIAQLSAYELKRMPGGGYRYGAPSGLHDDLVIALAIAWHGVKYTTTTPISFT
jgi:Terminase RNaseH-like domain/Terminase large subunit, T4likevirus-type, N-terminal